MYKTIDFHTHTFPDRIAAAAVGSLVRKGHLRAYSDGTAKGLASSMGGAGIDLSVILPVATSPDQVVSINSYAVRQNENTARTGLLSFGCMHPDFAGYREELGRIRECGIKGIKIHPPYQGVNLDDVRYLRIMDCEAQLVLIVVSHTGFDVGFPKEAYCTPKMARRAADQIGPFPLVLAHMGGMKEWDQVLEYLADTFVRIDTSFSTGQFEPDEEGHWTEEERTLLNQEEFLEMVKAFSAERILFGTDHPWSDPAAALAFIRTLPLDGAAKEKILGGNAAALLGLTGM